MPLIKKVMPDPAGESLGVETLVHGLAIGSQVQPKPSVRNLQPTDMRDEQRRIQRSGIWQAAIQSQALMQYAPTIEEYFVLLRKAADEGLRYVNELVA
jgi:hypothetical protein